MTGRSVPIWRGKTPDSKVPPRVRARIFLAHDGRCHLTGRRIATGEAWELEHIKPLCLGGEHSEANLAPALVQPHREKSAAELTVKAKADRIRAKHLGLKQPKGRPMPGGRQSKWRKKVSGEVVLR